MKKKTCLASYHSCCTCSSRYCCQILQTIFRQLIFRKKEKEGGLTWWHRQTGARDKWSDSWSAASLVETLLIQRTGSLPWPDGRAWRDVWLDTSCCWDLWREPAGRPASPWQPLWKRSQSDWSNGVEDCSGDSNLMPLRTSEVVLDSQ